MKILNLASKLSFESKNLLQKYSKDEILTISPLVDEGLENSEFIKCEIGSISYVLALLAQKVCNDEYFLSLDTGFLSGESNVGEEEIEEICEFLQDCELVILDKNIIKTHQDYKNNEGFLAILQEKFGFDIIDLDGNFIKCEICDFSNLKELENYDGSVVFKHLNDLNFIGGKYFCMVAKIKDGDEVQITLKNQSVKRKFILDEKLKGTIAFLGLEGFDDYNFEVAKISRI